MRVGAHTQSIQLTDCGTVFEEIDFQGDPNENLRRPKSKYPIHPPSLITSSDTEQLAFSRTLGGDYLPICLRQKPRCRQEDRFLALAVHDMVEGPTPDDTATIPYAYDLLSYSADFFDEEDV